MHILSTLRSKNPRRSRPVHVYDGFETNHFSTPLVARYACRPACLHRALLRFVGVRLSGPDSAHWPQREEASGMKVTLRRHAFDPDLARQRPRRLARRGERDGWIGVQAVHRAAGAAKHPRDESLAIRSAEFIPLQRSTRFGVGCPWLIRAAKRAETRAPVSSTRLFLKR